MLLVVYFANAKTLRNYGNPGTLVSDSTQQELSKEYQHDRVSKAFKKCCVIVLWMTVALALTHIESSPINC